MRTEINGSNTPPEVKDTWRTPPEVAAYFKRRYGIEFDLAADQNNAVAGLYFDESMNALAQEWGEHLGPCWCNPPYSNIGPWVEKAAASSGIVVMLVPASTCTRWFARAVETCSEVIFITHGRISFLRGDTGQRVTGNTRGSVVLVWGTKGEKWQTLKMETFKNEAN